MTSHLELDLQLTLDRFELRLEASLDRPSTGIFGPSGSGKTSLIESLAGLRRQARGRLVFEGTVWLDSRRGRCLSPEDRGIGWVPQDGLLFPHLDVRQNLEVQQRSKTKNTAGRGTSFDDVVDLLELGPLLERSVTTLSGGERQRVALGRALCSAPRLLLLDEPLSSLDLPLRRRLLPLLRRVRDELTVPMIFISHDPIEVQALCDDLLVLRQGKCIAQGIPAQVLSDPEVFAMAEERGYENIFPGTVKAFEGQTVVVTLAPEVVLRTETLKDCHLEVDHEVLIGLRADDILIATERPRGISARNILQAQVASLRPKGLIEVRLAPESVAPDLPPLIVQVTLDTPRQLGLEAGQEIFLLIKATACRVYGG